MQWQRISRFAVRGFSTSNAYRRVPLAYDVYKPSKTGLGNGSVILMHGLFGSKRNNRSITKVLAKDTGRPVYALDLRNHGNSPHDPKHDYNSMADDVEAFIHVHGLKDSTLIGHSMGAKTAMTVALRSPDSIGALVSVDNAPVDAVLRSDFAKYTQAMRRIEDAHITKQSEADDILKQYEKIRQFLLTNLIRPPDSEYLRFRVPVRILAGALDNMGDFPFKDPDEARFEKPTLFIRGTESPYVPDDVLPLIGRFFPRFELIDINSGHWVISEKPEEFRHAVVDFLKNHE